MTSAAFTHYVLFRLRTDLDLTQRERFASALNRLVADLPEERAASATKAMMIGHVNSRQAHWAFAARFPNDESLTEYLDAPPHQAFLAVALPLCESVLAIQSPPS